ncbi:hypothetical protein GCM10023259_026420 [Thermocatellispora tengchongensis]
MARSAAAAARSTVAAAVAGGGGRDGGGGGRGGGGGGRDGGGRGGGGGGQLGGQGGGLLAGEPRLFPDLLSLAAGAPWAIRSAVADGCGDETWAAQGWCSRPDGALP